MFSTLKISKSSWPKCQTVIQKIWTGSLLQIINGRDLKLIFNRLPDHIFWIPVWHFGQEFIQISISSVQLAIMTVSLWPIALRKCFFMQTHKFHTYYALQSKIERRIVRHRSALLSFYLKVQIEIERTRLNGSKYWPTKIYI